MSPTGPYLQMGGKLPVLHVVSGRQGMGCTAMEQSGQSVCGGLELILSVHDIFSLKAQVYLAPPKCTLGKLWPVAVYLAGDKGDLWTLTYTRKCLNI